MSENPLPRRRFRSLRGLGRDPRLVAVIAALGAVAIMASLMAEWQVTKVNQSEFFGNESGGPMSMASNVAEAGTSGGAYLVGLFPLVVGIVVLLFGPPVARPYAQLVTLGSGGVLLALLSALASTIGSVSFVVGRYFVPDGLEMQLALGRGLYCAVAGVAAVMFAAYLAGRLLPADGSWRWRASTPADDDERPAEPLDLAVGPAPLSPVMEYPPR